MSTMPDSVLGTIRRLSAELEDAKKKAESYRAMLNRCQILLRSSCRCARQRTALADAIAAELMGNK